MESCLLRSSAAPQSTRHSPSVPRRSRCLPVSSARATTLKQRVSHSAAVRCRRVGSVVARAEAKGESSSTLALDNDPEAEQDLKDMQDILDTMELLRTRRAMTVAETRLILMIEDPREAEKRRQLGVESDSGCSREELADAFTDVMEDRVPSDRLTLRTLAQEFRDWPRLRDQEAEEEARRQEKRSRYAEVTNVGLPGGKVPSRPRSEEWDDAAEVAEAEVAKEKDQKKDLGETLPNWVGYSVLYGVSSLPIIIGVVVVIILFVNSLQ